MVGAVVALGGVLGVLLVSPSRVAQQGLEPPSASASSPESALSEARSAERREDLPRLQVSVPVDESPQDPASLELSLEDQPDPDWGRGFQPNRSKRLYDLPIYHWDGELPKLPSYVYEEKYMDFDLREIQLAESEKLGAFRADVKAEFARLKEQGDYLSYVLELEVDDNGNSRVVGLDVSLSGDMPLFNLVTGRDRSGVLVSEFMWLPPEDPQYQALYLGMDEWGWLSHRVGQLTPPIVIGD